MDTITYLENGETFTVSFAELLNYHGTTFPGGVAHGLKVMQRAFPLLDEGRPIERREVRIDTAFPGPGGRDAIEFVTRALTDGRYHVDRSLGWEGIEESPKGKYYFRFSYRGTVVEVTIRPGHVRGEFIELARKEGRSAEEETRLAALKREMRDRLVPLAPEDVYDAKVSRAWALFHRGRAAWMDGCACPRAHRSPEIGLRRQPAAPLGAPACRTRGRPSPVACESTRNGNALPSRRGDHDALCRGDRWSARLCRGAWPRSGAGGACRLLRRAAARSAVPRLARIGTAAAGRRRHHGAAMPQGRGGAEDDGAFLHRGETRKCTVKIEIDQRGADRIHEDQRAFRRLLEAFSYPGKVVVLAEGQAAHAVVLSTLADTTTPLWIDESFADIRDRAVAARWPMADRASCTFALCRGEMLDRIDVFPKGTPADPHLSATVIAEVTGLSGGAALNLSGPGIGPGGRTFAPLGLPAAFLAQWTCNNAAYPLGIDLILTAGDRCACLPRSVRLEISDVRSR